MSVEKQSQGDCIRAPLVLSIIFTGFVVLPWSLPQPLHSLITHAVSVARHQALGQTPGDPERHSSYLQFASSFF